MYKVAGIEWKGPCGCSQSEQKATADLVHIIKPQAPEDEIRIGAAQSKSPLIMFEEILG